MAMVSMFDSKAARYYDKPEKMPVPVKLTVVRKAAWHGILVPSCECKHRSGAHSAFEMKKGWLHCSTCGKPVKPLDGVSELAPTLDEALIIALAKSERGE